jgi:hypothetical protein
MNGSIFAWYHADEQLRDKPLYELFNIEDEINRNNMEGKNKIKDAVNLFQGRLIQLLVRGESINYVNCHVQEIPENGIIIMNH